MKGGSLEPLIAERIRHLKTKALLNLLDYIYETVSLIIIYFRFLISQNLLKTIFQMGYLLTLNLVLKNSSLSLKF